MPKILRGAGFRRIRKAELQIVGANRKLGHIADIGTDKDGMERYLAKNIRAIVIQELMVSLRNSGLARRTGNLSRAVASSDVWIANGKLRYAFRAGLQPHIYRYGSALESGAVHNAKGFGHRAKRTAKRAFLGARLTRREHADQARKSHVGIAIRRPRPFYFLSAQGKRRIEQMLRSLFAAYVRDQIRRVS